MGSGPVDPQQHERRLPNHAPGLRVGALLPHIGIPVLGSCDDAVGVWGPVDGRDELVVLVVARATQQCNSAACCTNIAAYLRQRLCGLPLMSLARKDLHVV